MGGKSLMQKISILKISSFIVILSSTLFSASLSSTEIINMVSKIKQERKGISLVQLEGVPNPFMVKTVKKKKVPKPKETILFKRDEEIIYRLKAILNRAAFIDTKWYKRGDKLGEYTIGYIGKNSVILKGKNGNRVLKLRERKNTFIKLNRGYK